MDNTIQLEMNFQNKRHRFREKMESGSFIVLFEVNTPSRKEDFSSSSLFLKSMESAVLRGDIPGSLSTGLAITDKMKSDDSWNVADFANELTLQERDRHILFVSGKNSKQADITDTLNRCKASGFPNIVCVSGEKPISGKNAARSKINYYESIHTLNLIASREEKFFFPGCVVSPFKYTPSDLYTQYYKLVKKLSQGAGFIVTQAGWDMMKLQELRWYLEIRELHYSSIAKIVFLTPELVEEIITGKKSGVHISSDFRVMLHKETQFGLRQFASAQWRRIQFQAAGARLMGYTGVLLSGIERPDLIQTACKKISEALDEFKSFEDWKDAYVSHLARAEMAPYPNRFYIFNNLFTRRHPEIQVMNPSGYPPLKNSEKLRFKICKSLFSKSNLHDSREHFLTKKILVGCKGCSYCRLPLVHYICPETCPKGLSNGPCGGTFADGSCEFGTGKECIHSKRFRVAAWLNELYSIEERYIRPAEKR